MRCHTFLVPMLVLTAGCAASTYPLNPQLAAQAGLRSPGVAPGKAVAPGHGVSASFVQQGSCSWYGPGFHGRRTSNGEVFNKNEMTAAHPTLPFGSQVEVTDIQSGKKVTVRINDRGPFVQHRILDLSYAAAASLDIVDTGTAKVELRLVDIDEAAWPEQAWALQVASFPSKIDANHFIEGLSAQQRTAGLYYVKEPDGDAQDYRVRFGPFECEDSAKAAAARLKRVGLTASVLKEGATRAQDDTPRKRTVVR